MIEGCSVIKGGTKFPNSVLRSKIYKAINRLIDDR